MEELIQCLIDKIDGLERKLDQVLQQNKSGVPKQSGHTANTTLPNYIPDIDFHQWVQSFDVGKEDVLYLLENGVLDGFKTCLHKHMSLFDTKPVFVQSGGVGGRVKQTYIYYLVNSLTNEADWRVITDNDVYLLIEIIWRKMVQYYFLDDEDENSDDLTEDEKTQRDINKKTLLDMKKKLIGKHVKDIIRVISQICIETSSSAI